MVFNLIKEILETEPLVGTMGIRGRDRNNSGQSNYGNIKRAFESVLNFITKRVFGNIE